MFSPMTRGNSLFLPMIRGNSLFLPMIRGNSLFPPLTKGGLGGISRFLHYPIDFLNYCFNFLQDLKVVEAQDFQPLTL
jgi:hypothetical protein